MRNIHRVADPTAWGCKGIQSGTNLAKILNELGNPHIITRINGIILKYNMRLKLLSTVETILVKNNGVETKYFHDLLHVDTKKIVKKQEFPRNVESHLLTLVTAKYRNVYNGKTN